MAEIVKKIKESALYLVVELLRTIVRFLIRKDKRWSLEDEMSKLFTASLNSCFPDLKEEADLFPSFKEGHGDYNCQNVLTIWITLKKNLELRNNHPHIQRPRHVGEAIKKNLQKSDMIEGQPFVSDVGIVTFSLSSKWMAERIHKMLQDGIDTWAPILPVERVLVKLPSLMDEEETEMGLLRQEAIAHVLVEMLKFSKVDTTCSYTSKKDMVDSPRDILERWFSVENTSGGDLVIDVKDKPPFTLAEKDLYYLPQDLTTLRDGFEEEKADWIVYVTPVRQQEYIEMFFTVAKLEKWTPTDTKWKWIPDGTSYAGYGTCSVIEPEEVDLLLAKLEHRCHVVAHGEDARLLGYSGKAVCNFVLTYTFLKTKRLANLTFAPDEMAGEEGNTFVYLLNTRAKFRRITNEYRKHIDELIKAPDLVLENSNRRGECEEHELEVHLLEFTVMDFKDDKDYEYDRLLFAPHYKNNRDPRRNSRFELFSIRLYITTDSEFEKGEMFGFIAVSDKYGLLSDGVSHLFEPDFAYVPLFNHEWCDPIDLHNGEYIYLGNPSSRNSVAFSSSIEISMDIYVTTEEKNACFELCSRKFKLDLLDIWGKEADNECHCIKVKGEDGFIEMHYMLIKDAVDAAVKIKYKTEPTGVEASGCKVRGQIYAYYGSDILYHCRASMRTCYWALLFRSDVPFALEGDKIPLRKSVLAVPKGAPLIISAYLYDVISGEVILDGICTLDSKTKDSKGDIKGLEGTKCSLSLEVDWTYQA